MTDRYGADRQVPRWHAELRPESRDQRGRDPEEQRAEALVDGGEQQPRLEDHHLMARARDPSAAISPANPAQ